MRIVFLGDISVAGPSSYSFQELDFLDDADQVIANLEGPILPEQEIDLIENKNERVLYNSLAVKDVLQTFRVNAVSLANNHVFDHGDSIQFTMDSLREAGKGYFGAGHTLDQARAPLVLSSPEQVIKIFGYGWDVIGCQYAGDSTAGVNPFEPDLCLRNIRELRAKDTNSIVIYFIHWNYELEDYPQPADRQLARKLIDEGVDAVIGLHPHIPQGGELYRGKPIIYSLGNWFFPARSYGRIALNFSPSPSRQIALEVNFKQGESHPVRFHWVILDPLSQKLRYEGSEGWDGEMINNLTPFSGMSDKEYLIWFRRNKKKRFTLPIYRDYRLRLENSIKDHYVKLRQQMIWLLVKLHLKK